MPEQFLHGIDVVEIDAGLRPIRTVRTSVIGLVGTAPGADDDKFPADTPVLIAGDRREAAGLGLTGTLPAAIDGIFDQIGAVVVMIRVEEGADEAATMANVIGGIDDATGAYTGIQALLGAEAFTGQKPKILVAPGYSSSTAVSAELIVVARRLKGILFSDGPNTNDADAIAWRGGFGSDRQMIIDPWATVFSTTALAQVADPPSARAAGILAKLDATKGFWWSPSNQIMEGITGTTRVVDHALSDPNCRANLLNEAEVTTIVERNGKRLWGNRSTSEDPLYAFLSVRRTADAIFESIERAHAWALDRPFSEQLMLDVRDSVQAYLDTLRGVGAILGGTAYIDPAANSEAALKAGRLFIDFDFEPPAPLEHLTFRAHRNGDYYEEVVARVATAA